MKKNKILVLSLTGVLALGTVSAYAASKADLINSKADTTSSATAKTATKNNVKLSDVKLTEEDAKKIALEDSKNGEIKEVKLKKRW